MAQDRLATLPLHCGTRTKPRRLGADLRTIDHNKTRRPIMVGGFYCGSNNRSIGAFYLLECGVRRGTTPPWRRGRERTEFDCHATTKYSPLSIPDLDREA